MPPPNLNLISRNVDKARRAKGITQVDLDDYVREESGGQFTTENALRAALRRGAGISVAADASGREAAAIRKAADAVGGLGASPAAVTAEIGRTMNTRRAATAAGVGMGATLGLPGFIPAVNRAYNDLKDAAPGEAMAGEIVGGLLTPGGITRGVGNFAARGASLGTRALRGAVAGGAVGGLTAAGTAREGQRGSAAALGTAGGAVLGGLLTPAAELLPQAVASGAQRVGRTAASVATDATAAPVVRSAARGVVRAAGATRRAAVAAGGAPALTPYQRRLVQATQASGGVEALGRRAAELTALGRADEMMPADLSNDMRGLLAWGANRGMDVRERVGETMMARLDNTANRVQQDFRAVNGAPLRPVEVIREEQVAARRAFADSPDGYAGLEQDFGPGAFAVRRENATDRLADDVLGRRSPAVGGLRPDIDAMVDATATGARTLPPGVVSTIEQRYNEVLTRPAVNDALRRVFRSEANAGIRPPQQLSFGEFQRVDRDLSAAITKARNDGLVPDMRDLMQARESLRGLADDLNVTDDPTGFVQRWRDVNAQYRVLKGRERAVDAADGILNAQSQDDIAAIFARSTPEEQAIIRETLRTRLAERANAGNGNGAREFINAARRPDQTTGRKMRLAFGDDADALFRRLAVGEGTLQRATPIARNSVTAPVLLDEADTREGNRLVRSIAMSAGVGNPLPFGAELTNAVTRRRTREAATQAARELTARGPQAVDGFLARIRALPVIGPSRAPVPAGMLGENLLLQQGEAPQ